MLTQTTRAERAFKLAGLVSSVAVCIFLTACSQYTLEDKQDPGIDKDRQAYRRLSEPPDSERGGGSKNGGDDGAANQQPRAAEPPAVPDMAPMTRAPQAPELSPNPRVSVSVTEDVPLKDVLFRLARQAGVEIEIDPRITGGIVFSANDRRFLSVIKRISRLAGLRYEIDDNVVRVLVDEAFQKTYNLPYITRSRQTQSQISISTELATPGAQQQGGGGDTSSTSVVQGSSTADFYTELQQTLQTVVANTQPRGQPQANQGESYVTIHRQAGIISVFGTSRQHDAVKRYLREIRNAVNAQVLIEAKIVEIDLNRQYRSGVNWRGVLENIAGGATASVGAPFGTQPASPPFGSFQSATNDVVTLGLETSDFGVLLNLAERFGTTRTLSSPRMTVMNNQTALLKVAENQVFFELDVEREEFDDNQNRPDGLADRLTIDSQIRSLPIGLVMSVQPAINLRQDRVTLTLRPTITRVTDTVNDPAVAILSDNQVQSSVPVVQTRELDSVLKLDSGEVAVLGGLMQETQSNTDDGVPGLAEIPWVGRAFKSRQEETNLTELVVFLRARILQAPEIRAADVRAYEEFTEDPRPLDLPEGAGRRAQ